MTFNMLLNTGRDLLEMLIDMSNKVTTFFTTELLELVKQSYIPEFIKEFLSDIIGELPIGAYTPLQLMFGSGITIILIIVLKNFIL